jgi:hypothetical protein
MKTRYIETIVLCSTALFIVSCPGLVTAAQLLGRPVKPDPEAVAAGNRWFAIFDSGDYKTARRMWTKRVQRGGALHEEQFIAWARERRAPLGRVLRRELMWARFTNTLPGAPDGNYEFLRYKTSFEHKAQAEEELTLTKESGHWEVSGYHFK